MKNLKKILSFVVAMALTASVVPSVLAEGESADAQPEVLVYRDYEELADNADEAWDFRATTINTDGKHGVSNLGPNTGIGLNAFISEGADGKGIGFNSKDTSTSGGFANVNFKKDGSAYTSGKMYIAFDMQRKSDAELDEQDGTTDGYKFNVTEDVAENLVRDFVEGDEVGKETELSNTTTGAKTVVEKEIITAVSDTETTYTLVTETKEKVYVTHDTYFYINGGDGTTQQYGRIFTRHTNSKAAPWQGTNPGVYIPDENVHRYEYVIDLDNDTFKGYVDGKQVGAGTQYAADLVKFNFTLTNAIKYMDNFTVVHYPTDCANTFSLTARDYDMANNTLNVDFDNDAKTVTDTNTYVANYPAVITSEVTNDTFLVTNSKGEAVEISNVSKNAATGSYAICLADGIVVGEKYTVSVVSEVTESMGATLDATKTAVFELPVAKVLYHNDYESYTSGKDLFSSVSGNGLTPGQNAAMAKNSTAVTGVDGTAVCVGRATGAPLCVLAEPITEGVVYIGFDVESRTAEELTAMGLPGDHNFITIYSSDNTTGKYARFGTGAGTYGWEDAANYGQLSDGYHRLELLVNLDDGKVYSYLDGQLKNKMDYARNNFAKVNFSLGTALGSLPSSVTNTTDTSIKLWDNVSIIHYPEGAVDTFSVVSKGIDFENNALKIDFDNNAESTVDTKTFKADYPVILANDLTVEDVTVTKSNGEEVNVLAVNKNTAFGSYNVVLEEAVADDEIYTVSVSADLTTTLGAEIKDITAEFETPAVSVFLYRDYEDYKGSAWDAYIVHNSDKKWGSWISGHNQTLRENSKAVQGPSGTAVDIGKATGNPNADLPYVLDSGVFYFGVDVEKESDAFFDALDGTTNGLNADGKTITHENYITLGNSSNWAMYARFGTGHSAAANCVSGWGGHDFTKVPNLTAGYHRYEIIADLDADKVTIYLDGAALGTSAYTYDITRLTFQFDQGIAKWDNLAVLHYPQGVRPQTFSLQNAKADVENDTITVSLKSDTKNSSYKAPYNVQTEAFTKDDFVVTDAKGSVLEVGAVTPGAMYGEYVIELNADLVKGSSYSVVATAERTDNLGATLNTDAVAEVYIAPDVYTDEAFDGYKGGWFNTTTITGQKITYQQAVEDAKYGTGLDLFLPEGQTWLLSALTVPFGSAVNEGKLVISFDWMYNDFPNKRQQVQLSAAPGAETGAFAGNYYLAYFDKTADSKVSVQTPVAVGSWNNNAAKILEADTMYHFEFVFDYESGKYEGFVNGESLGGYNITPGASATNGAYLSYSVGTSFLDNIKVAYSDADSFVINRAVWQGDYAEVLVSEGASLDTLALADSVVVKDEAGNTVDAEVEISGRRVLIAGLDKSKSYTVTLPENYKSVTGNTLAERTAVIEAGEFTVVSVDITDENGTPVNKADLEAGDKVYAAVTYVNESGKDKTFTLMGATYAEGRMTDTNFKNITASGSVTAEVTETVELDVTDVTELEIKAFTVESLTNLKIFGESVVK